MKRVILAIGFAFFVIGTMCLFAARPIEAAPICNTVVSVPSYAHPYVKPHVVHHDKVAIVQAPVIVKVESLEFAYSSKDYLRDQQLIETQKTLQETMQMLKALNLQIKNGKLVEVPEMEEAERILVGIPTPAEIAPSVSASNDLQSVIATSCLSCHTGTKNNIDLSDLTKLGEEDILAVQKQVVLNLMPPVGKRPPLTNSQKRLIAKWDLGK
jgi:hypothetical protein